MLAIRFARVGKRNKAQFKIVLQERTVAPGGRHVEILGSYDPHTKQMVLKEEKLKYWISKGAQLSDTVHNLLVAKEVISAKKRPVKLPKKEAPATENPAESKTESAETPAPEKTEKPAEEPAKEVKPSPEKAPKAE